MHWSSYVPVLPSSHVVPSGLAGLEQLPVAGSHVPASWHWSSAVHTTELPPVQVPAWQVSVCVQASPSLHAVPSALAGFEQRPPAGSQTPATWHWFWAVQTTGLPPVQAPAWQVSVRGQAVPSPQLVPVSGVTVPPAVQSPARGLQWSEVQVTAVPPLRPPLVQVSVWLQASPSSHAAPVLGVTVQLAVPLQMRVLHASEVHVMAVPTHCPPLEEVAV